MLRVHLLRVLLIVCCCYRCWCCVCFLRVLLPIVADAVYALAACVVDRVL